MEEFPPIGRFKVLAKLGSGSYGDVFKVEDDGGRHFALKRIQGSAPKDAAKRFENEIWALRSLDHPSIPKFIERGEDNGQPFFVMTFCQGASLRRLHEQLCQDLAPCGVTRVPAVLGAVLNALVPTHERGSCHRDIKDEH